MDPDDLYSGGLDSNLGFHSQLEPPSSGVPDLPPSDIGMSMEPATDAGAESDTSEASSLVSMTEEDDDLVVLRRAWINERNSPELYMYEGAALENLMELVDFQLKTLDTQPANIQNVIRMDADRVKYLVRSYLRTRLNKIEQYAGYVLREMKERLSQAELEYAQGFRSLQDGHAKRTFLDQFPAHLRQVDEVTKDGLKMVPEPDMDRAVFCRVRATVGQFQFDEREDPIVMKKGNIFITQYSIVRDLLRDGKVELI